MVKCNEYSVSIMVDCYHHKWDTEGCFVLSKMFVPIVICIVLKILVKSGVLCINMILCIQPKTTSISFNFRNGHQTQMGRGIVFLYIYTYLICWMDIYISQTLWNVNCQPKSTCPMLHVCLSGRKKWKYLLSGNSWCIQNMFSISLTVFYLYKPGQINCYKMW